MTLAPSASDKLEYLVCSWPLNSQRNGLRRFDALSRTLSAALLRGHNLHVWCELAMISLTPEFLEVWAPATEGATAIRGGQVDYAEGRLSKLMRDVFADVTIKGASIRHSNCGGKTPKSAAEVILQDVQHVLFLNLNRHSCALHIEGEAVPFSSVANQSAGNLLVVLGGVMDVSPEEEATILEVCRERDVSHHTVSLGQRQLLTSQCIKILEASGATGLLQKALARCNANHWFPDRGLPCPWKQHPPLHVVKVLDESIESFIKRPKAAALLVDMYLFSHGQGSAELSLVSVDATLTVPSPPPGQLILQEASAHEYLQRVADQSKRRSIRIPGSDITPDACIAHGLTQVLLETPSKTHKRLSGHLILLAQEGYMVEVAPLTLPFAPSHVSNPIAVIIAPDKFTKTICEVGKAAKQMQCRYMGSAQEVPSFVGMLFNDGLLGEMMLSPHHPTGREVACKSVEVELKADTDIPDAAPESVPDFVMPMMRHSDADSVIGDEVSTAPETAPRQTNLPSSADIDDEVSTAPEAALQSKVPSEADTDIGDEASVVALSTGSELCNEWIQQALEKKTRSFTKKEAAITTLEKRQLQNTQLNPDEEKKLSTGPIVREVLAELKEFQRACESHECDAIAELLRRQIRKLCKKQRNGKASEFEMLVLKELCLVEEEFKHVFGDQGA